MFNLGPEEKHTLKDTDAIYLPDLSDSKEIFNESPEWFPLAHPV